MAGSTATKKAFLPCSDELFFLEESDQVFEITTQMPLKRLCSGHGNLGPASKRPKTELNGNDENGSTVDKDYQMFLYALEKYGKEPQHFKEEVEEGRRKGENGAANACRGPHIEKLRKNGNSYALRSSRNNVMPVCIKYEEDDNCQFRGNGLNLATKRKLDKANLATPRGGNKCNVATLVENGSAPTSTRKQCRRSSAIPSKERNISAVPNGHNWATIRKLDKANLATPRGENKRNVATLVENGSASTSTRKQCRRNSAIPSEERKISAVTHGHNWATQRKLDEADLATPRGENKRNVATLVENGRASTSTRKECKSSLEIPSEEREISAVQNGHNWATQRKLDKANLATPRGENEWSVATLVENGSAPTSTRKECRGSSAIPSEKGKISSVPNIENSRISIFPGEDGRNSVSHREGDTRDSMTQRANDFTNTLKTECKQTTEVACVKPYILKEEKIEMLEPINCASNRGYGGSSVNSESFQLLRNCQKLVDFGADILTKSCKQPKFEKNDGETLFQGGKFMTKTAKDVNQPLHEKGSIGRDQLQFREKLSKALGMPYSQKEYEELLHLFTDRKQMQQHRDLRGGIKTYDAGVLGKSYRDHYPDLAAKIDSARFDRDKILDLLRGFFFWLTNVSHQGAFKPWLDP